MGNEPRALTPSEQKTLHEAWKASAPISSRACTCHPDDNPPRPCPQKFALTDCRLAAAEARAEAAEQALAEAGNGLVTAREALEAIAQMSIAEVGERPESLNRIIEANQECASRAVAEMHGAGIRMADGSVSLPAILEKKPTKGTP